MTVKAALKDSPYRFVRRLSDTEIELAYGDIHERWRRADKRNVSQSPHLITVRGIDYRFAGQIRRGLK